MLVDLEAPDILGCSRIGRAPQKRGEAPDMPDVVVLGVWPQAAHQHVVLRALTQQISTTSSSPNN